MTLIQLYAAKGDRKRECNYFVIELNFFEPKLLSSMNNMRFSIIGFANILTAQSADVNYAEVITITILNC
jgi:hypothetical protein